MGVAWIGLIPALAAATTGVGELAWTVDLRPPDVAVSWTPREQARVDTQGPPGGRDSGVGAGISSPELDVAASRVGGGPSSASALARAPLRDGEDRIGVEARLGRVLLVQKEVARRFTLAALSADSLVSRSGFALSAEVSTWFESVAPRLLGGRVAAGGTAAPHASWGVRLSHEPIWRSTGTNDPLRGLRVQDLNQLNPRLAATELALSAALEPSSGRGFQLEVGATSYADGNRRISTRAEAHLSLLAHGSTRLDLKPAGYREASTRSTRGFLTPRAFASLGAGLQLVSTVGPLAVDATVEPHVFRFPHRSGFGIRGQIRSSLEAGPSLVRISAELLSQGPNTYVQVRVMVGSPITAT